MGPIAATLVNYVHLKILISIGSTISITAIFLCSTVSTFGAFRYLFGGIVTFGISFVYFPTLISGWQWIPDRKGLVSGVIVGGFGFGAFVFNLICTAVVNPGNVRPYKLDNGSIMYDEQIAERVPLMFRVVAIVWSLLVIVALTMVK